MQRFRSVALFAVVQFALVLGPLHAHAAGSGAEVPVTPAPDWVTRIPIASSPADAVSAADGIVEELVDDEIRVGAAIERYRHRVQKLTSTAGVEIAGQVEISFDPSYEHLSLHSLVIGRGDQRIDALKRASIRVLQQESDLDEQVYNGALTALVVVKDLRVGDTLDLEYTLTGANPVFGGRLVDSELLASPHGAERLRVRLLTPAGRSIAARTVGIDLAPSERVSEGLRELVWERRAVPPARLDDQVPSWFVAYPYLSFSELPTWGDVARWATPLFAEATAPAPAVTAKAAEIAASSGSAEERALAALRFVQDDVRYLGIEMGANSHRPHDATQVLEQRFGDCKDKTVLLVSLLRALGLEAEPALVDAWAGEHVSSRPPSPFAFNHAIAHLKLDGRDVWVDPTRSQERGPLGGSPVPYGRALIVNAGSTELATIPRAPLSFPTIESGELFTFDGRGATLDVATTYRGLDADAMRQRVARTPREKLQADALNYYATIYPTIEPAGVIAIADDPVHDQIVVTERYALKDPLGQGGLDVAAEAIRGIVHKPKATRRTTPLAVPFPAYRRDVVVVKGVSLYGLDDKALHDDALDFTRRADTRGDTMKITFELRSKRGALSGDGVAAHVALLGEILDATVPTLGVAEVAKTHDETRRASRVVGALVGIGALVLGARLAASRFRRRRWRAKIREHAGETAAQAQEAPSRVAAERILLAAKCACGGAFADRAEWSTLAYGDRAVTAGRTTCAACGERRVRYFQGALPE